MNKSVVMSFRFTGELPQIKTINYIRESFGNLFNKSIETLNFSVLDKTSSNWKLKTKTLKFNQSNLNKYEDILKNKTDTVYIDFELSKNLENYDFKSRDIDFSVIYKITEKINSLNFIFNDQLYADLKWDNLSKNIINFLLENNCEIDYGFIFSISNSKNPSLYVEGIGNYEISQKEQDKLDIWLKGMKDCDKNIWDIFWGNIVSVKNLNIEKETLTDDIKKIVGNESFFFLTRNLIWFNLTENLKDFEILKYNNTRDKLYKYFKMKGLILH